MKPHYSNTINPIDFPKEEHMNDFERGYEKGKESVRVKAVKLRREGYDVMLPILEDNWGHVVVAGLPWAKLKNEEIESLIDNYDVASLDYARAIEAKLKEKNT